MNFGHFVREITHVANIMPHTRLLRTNERASENVVVRERPSKLPNQVDEGSKTQADLPYQ